jgi:hypothetical protein
MSSRRRDLPASSNSRSNLALAAARGASQPSSGTVRGVQERPLPSSPGVPLRVDRDGLGLHKTHATNGGYLTQSAPSGGLPYTSAFGRGWLFMEE